MATAPPDPHPDSPPREPADNPEHVDLPGGERREDVEKGVPEDSGGGDGDAIQGDLDH